MNKEEILQMSRQENQGKYDERELSVLGIASQIGMLVGAILCVALVIVGRYVFDIPELGFGGWLVYFAMQGTNNVVLYKYLKTRSKLIVGVIEIVLAVVFAVALVVKNVV